jgi:RHS repeat-associated protein
LTDAPAFSQWTETATSAPTAVYSYSTSTGSGTKTFTVTMPDSSQMLLTRSTTGANDGLLIESEVKNSSGVSMAKSQFTYANDPGGSPQVQSVIGYDDAGAQTKVDFDFDQYGNVTNSRQYGYQISGAWQVRRRTRSVFKTDTAYVNAYLRSLVIESNVYDALENTNDGDDVMIAKSTMTYDDYAAMGGMQTYSTTPPGHESSFNTSYATRGNVTGMTEYKDIAAAQTITHLRKFDLFGSVTKEQLDCCTEREYMRNDTNCYNSPVEVKSGTTTMQLSTMIDDDLNTGLVGSQTDPRGKTTFVTYDAALRSDVVTSHTGATTDANYNDSALTSSQTVNYTEGVAQKSVTTTSSYDGWGRMITAVGPNGAQVNTTYDSMGRVWKQTNPFTSGQTPVETVNTFDALGRATTVTLPDGQTVQTSYNGSTVTVTDQVNRKMKREADGLGRLVKVYEQTSAGGTPTQETVYTYDLMDRLKEVNQGGQLRKYKFDDMGRLLYEKIPEQTATINDGTGTLWTTKYTYTDHNQVSTRQDARGVITSYVYDDLQRMTQVSYNVSGAPGVASTPSVTMSYDTTDGSATEGLLLSVSVSGQSSETYGYDTNNRVQSVTRTIGSRTYTTSYQFTQAGQLTQLTYPSTRAININHDNIGRLSSIVNNADSANYLSGISYKESGQVGQWTLGTNIAESFGYNNRLQMTSQTVTQNGQTRMSLTYGYQASAGQMGGGTTAGNAGQLISVSGSIGGATESAAYTYDNVGRLATSNQTSNSVSAQRRFIYDRWGNRTSVYDAVTGGNQIQSVALEQSGGAPTNRITSVTQGSTVNYSHDSAGNVTNDGAHSFTYDAENRVVSVDGGATASYSYDHQNRRIKKTVGSTTTHYVWEGSQVIAEHNGSTGAMTNEYVSANGKMIAREGGSSGRIYFLNDRLSVRATITDGNGNIQGRQSHLPFGEELNATGTTDKHKFTSYERDNETGTDYAVNRQYGQGVGRFMQVDKVAGNGLPQRFNRYSYTRNNPTNRTDPLGLDDDCPPGYKKDEEGNCLPDGGDYGGVDIDGEDPFIDPFFGDFGRLLDGDGFIDPRKLENHNLPQFPGLDVNRVRELLRNLSDAVHMALNALFSKPGCASLFNLPPDTNPADLLNRLYGGQLGSIGYGNLGGPNQSGNVSNAQTTGILGSGRVSVFVGANIRINSNPAAPFNRGYGGRFGLDDATNRAITLIHELGHAAQFIYGTDSTRIVDDQNNPSASQTNSQLVRENCF